ARDDAIESCAPGRDQIGTRLEVRDAGGNAFQVGAEYAGSAHQGELEIKVRQRLAASDQLVSARIAFQQRSKGWLTFHEHVSPTGPSQLGVAKKMNRVAESLFGGEQERLARKRLSV